MPRLVVGFADGIFEAWLRCPRGLRRDLRTEDRTEVLRLGAPSVRLFLDELRPRRARLRFAGLLQCTTNSGAAADPTQTRSELATVVNRRPRAIAGKNVTITTASERGVKVTLDGSRSSDPDQHKLKYASKAKGVKLVPH